MYVYTAVKDITLSGQNCIINLFFKWLRFFKNTTLMCNHSYHFITNNFIITIKNTLFHLTCYKAKCFACRIAGPKNCDTPASKRLQGMLLCDLLYSMGVYDFFYGCGGVRIFCPKIWGMDQGHQAEQARLGQAGQARLG